ncbi:flagellar biosynthesis sigma factor [Paraburkholderia sp. BL10I2N1]|uniref:flagellar biosynthesis sigma factor n=1 Tax=Paraburkholderia sp. BL10I2N1 TaxID=1938796 RepID=UPI001FB60255|nr:flagellar biosynthesis sigma factor [Paraburkholderia sp. BL10I2N1]
MAKPVDEVVLTLGESYEQVRQQSRSTLPPVEPDAFWAGYINRPAKFRFADSRYQFVTPAAKFLTVGYDERGNVLSVTLSPQVETLPLDQAMAVMLDLQDQLQRHGWHPIRPRHYPPISNTPAMIESIRRGDDPQTFWQAAGKYQVALDIRRFVHEDRPKDERYLITLQLSGPPLMEDYPKDN